MPLLIRVILLISLYRLRLLQQHTLTLGVRLCQNLEVGLRPLVYALTL
jgi:hypothetical protein